MLINTPYLFSSLILNYLVLKAHLYLKGRGGFRACCFLTALARGGLTPRVQTEATISRALSTGIFVIKIHFSTHQSKGSLSNWFNSKYACGGGREGLLEEDRRECVLILSTSLDQTNDSLLHAGPSLGGAVRITRLRPSWEQ